MHELTISKCFTHNRTQLVKSKVLPELLSHLESYSSEIEEWKQEFSKQAARLTVVRNNKQMPSLGTDCDQCILIIF
jgi:hypothetical protein